METAFSFTPRGNADVDEGDWVSSMEAELENKRYLDAIEERGTAAAYLDRTERERKLVEAEFDAGLATPAVFASAAYEEAFRTFLRCGAPFASEKARTISTRALWHIAGQDEKRVVTGDGTGSYLVAGQSFADAVESALKTNDELFDVARLVTTDDGRPFSMPIIDDSNQAATQVSEGAISVMPPTSDLGLDRLLFPKCPTWRSGYLRVSNELIRDSAFDVAEVVAAAAGQRFAAGIGAAFISTLLTQSVVGKTAASQTAIVADEVVDLVGSLDPKHMMRGAFLMHPSVFVLLKKLKASTAGSYMFDIGETADGRPTILNKPVYFAPGMTATPAAAAKVICFGNVGAFVRRSVRNGLLVYRDHERFAEYDQTGFQVHLRCDGALTKTTNGPIPIRFLQMAP